jgi:hypothetical protein
MFLTTANQDVADEVIAKARASGIDPKSIFVEPVGANVQIGNGNTADDLVTPIRYAVPRNSSAGSDWLNEIAKNVVVYKITSSATSIAQYPTNQYTSRTGNPEVQLQPQLDELAGLLQTWLAARTPAPEVVETNKMSKTTEDSPDGIPHGLVGSDCIKKGTICLGDNQNTSTYAFSRNIILSDTDIVFVAGINHNSLNNSSYIALDINNATESAGVASASQTNPDATGFDSGILTGSARAVLQDLGLYNMASSSLVAALPNLYVTLVSRTCNVATTYCLNLNGDSLIPANAPIKIFERSYLNPGTTTGADTNIMVYPNVVSAGLENN